MTRSVLLSIIILGYTSRVFFLLLKGKQVKFLILSFLIFTFPLEIIVEVTNPTKELAGTIWPVLNISLPVLIALTLLFQLRKTYVNEFNFKFKNWIIVIVFFIVISLVNPYNVFRFGTIIYSYFVFVNIFLFYMIKTKLSKNEIIEGIYDGFLWLGISQFLLSICFPVMGIIGVTTLFHASGEEWATRLGGRSGAIGFFLHPGNLALCMIISSSFILSCYLNGYKRKISFLILIINSLVLYLTYSRTSLVAYFIVIALLIFLSLNPKRKIFSVSNLIKFIIPVTLVLVWIIYFTPLGDQFTGSDSSEQYDNRMLHWLLALTIFGNSPIFGVGLNTHLAYLKENYSIVAPITSEEFYGANPIHNIHLIVLSEVGLIGLISWCYFIFSNIAASKRELANEQNQVMALSLIGLLVAYLIYGMTGWAPFSTSILPFFILLTYFSISFRNDNKNL